LPMYADLVGEGAALAMSAETEVTNGVKIVVGDVVIRLGANVDWVLLTRLLQRVRASAS